MELILELKIWNVLPQEVAGLKHLLGENLPSQVKADARQKNHEWESLSLRSLRALALP